MMEDGLRLLVRSRSINIVDELMNKKKLCCYVAASQEKWEGMGVATAVPTGEDFFVKPTS